MSLNSSMSEIAGTVDSSSTETLQAELRETGVAGGELQSTFEDILESCPKIRILLLGKSGVGKSSLINAIFGETVVEVSRGNKAGVSDINTEVTVQNKNHVVLHDSQGFSHGDNDNFNTVKKFIEDRHGLKTEEKLHAIWLCLQVPAYGGSLIQKSDEEILEFADSRGVPIIIVFTQLDKLVSRKRQQAKRAKLNVEITPESVVEDFHEQYRTQLEVVQAYKCVHVSVKPEYKQSQVQLVQLTEKALSPDQEFDTSSSAWTSSTALGTDVEEAASIVWASVQCPDIESKVKTSIQVGRKKYWRGLSTSLKFPGHTLDKFLKVVHKDIVRTWGFQDPGLLLESHILTKGLSNLQEDLVDENTSNKTLHISFGTATTVATIVSALVPPAAPFVAPIAGGLVFADWVYCVFEATPQTLRGIMGYIVDLIIVMQRLFWLTQAQATTEAAKSRGKIVATVCLDEHLVESAFNSYTNVKDGHKNAVHSAIRDFASVRHALKRELVLKTITDLIQKYRYYQPQENATTIKGRSSVLSSDSSTPTLVG